VPDVTETFGERLRRLRTERGLTVVDLAAALGVVEGTIRQLESGAVKWPSLQLGLRIAAHLDVDPRYLALGEQPSMSHQFAAMEKRLAKLEQQVASLTAKRR
jgi:transcriptional regulator with XRE-family HTH domain